MRFDGHDSGDREREQNDPAPLPLDAAESIWDPWLWALYLRELAGDRQPALH